MTVDEVLDLPLNPPDDWLTPPEAMIAAAAEGKATQSTYLESGRCFGHVCQWDTVLRDGTGQAWSLPRTIRVEAGMQGHVVTASGAQVKTGLILTDRNHTDVSLPLNAARSFWAPTPQLKPMENTGAQLASVVYGTDDVGVWFAGALLPGTTKTQLARARASAVSLECWPDPSEPSGYSFLGCQAVGVPGLPLGADAMPRAAALIGGLGLVAEDPVTAASKQSTKGGGYKIAKGDTLSALAKQHGTTVAEIMKANPSIKDKNKIYAGDELAIPKAKTDATSTGKAAPAKAPKAEKDRGADGGANSTPAQKDRGADGGANSTPAPSGPSKSADARAKLKELTAQTRVERKAIYDAAAAQVKATPGSSAQVRADKSAKLQALREKAKAQADAIRAQAKTAGFGVADDYAGIGEIHVARTAGAIYEARPRPQFAYGELVMIPGGTARVQGTSTALDGRQLVRVQLIDADGTFEQYGDDSDEVLVPIEQVHATGLELHYAGDDCDVPGPAMVGNRARIVLDTDSPATAATKEDAMLLPETDSPANVLIAALADQVQALEERVQTLEDRANAGEADPDPAVAALADVEAIDPVEDADMELADLEMSLLA